MTAEETDWIFYERLNNIENAYNAKSENFYWLSTLSKEYTLSTSRLFMKKQNEVQPTETFVFLANAIQKTNAKLVIIDSWINFYGVDENSTEDSSIVYDYLKSLIRNYGCSFAILHHQTKESMKGQANIFRGAMVFREQARTRIVLSKKNGQKIIEIEESNYPSELIAKFPIGIEFHNGIWSVTNHIVIYDEEEEKKKKGNGNNRKCINTLEVNEKWQHKPADYF